MPLAHLVDPFKQVKLFVTEEVEGSNGEKSGSTGEMQVEELDHEDDMREIEVANITRAGCEKPNVNQFELLRVLGQVGKYTWCPKKIVCHSTVPKTENILRLAWF